jgi:hypothetical protein
MLVFVGAICLGLALVRFKPEVTLNDSRDPAIPGALYMLGLFTLAGSTAAFVGKLYSGSTNGARQGFCYACLALLLSGYLVTLLSASVNK